ncbi:MAG: hypothetical protein U1C51_06670 [Candidatus Izemoplasmatales bacterium]|jgi:hypothetical protein|nr:hypothetical protein [bacterium]MDZ4196917.1 hypothetical protein [Candidatus Izemoplasmatales bacterium]
MREYIQKIKRLKHEFGLVGILSALFGGFVFSTLLFLPILLILGSITTLYMHILGIMSSMIWLTFFLYVFVFFRLVKQAFLLKNPQSTVDYPYLFKVHVIITEIIVFILGVIYFVVLMPRIF